ncbi:hypothetical protein ACTA71_003871 [Dictyostelium dimigraforme]
MNLIGLAILIKCPQLDIETIKSSNIEQSKEKLSSNIKYSRLFQSDREYDEANTYHYKIKLKSTRIIAKLLFPLKNDDSNNDTAQSSFNNEILEDFNSNNNIINRQHQIVCNIIKESLLPILNEKMVFRILGFEGLGSSLSLLALNKITELLREFPNVHIIFKSFDLEKQQQQQQIIKPSNYDFVIMSNVLHFTSDIKVVLDQILKPNGQILSVEPINKSILFDNIFGVFNQWLYFKRFFESLLLDCNFINSKFIISSFYITQTQKPSISNLNSTTTTIIFGENEFSFIKNFNNENSKVITISSIHTC